MKIYKHERNIRKRGRPGMGLDRVKLALEMRAQGKSLRWIAGALGVSKDAVFRALSRNSF